MKADLAELGSVAKRGIELISLRPNTPSRGHLLTVSLGSYSNNKLGGQHTTSLIRWLA